MKNQKYPESRKQLLDAPVVRDYIHGGRGIVTLTAPSGTSHSYKFSKPVNSSEFPDDVIFVYALHESKLFYIGMMEGDRFRLTHNSRFLEDTDIVKGAKYIVRMSINDSLCKTSPMKLYHEGMCAKCGRQLTQEKSINRGFGPKCRKKFDDEMLWG